MMQDGGNGGSRSPNGSEDGSKEIKVHLCFILANCGHSVDDDTCLYSHEGTLMILSVLDLLAQTF